MLIKPPLVEVDPIWLLLLVENILILEALLLVVANMKKRTAISFPAGPLLEVRAQLLRLLLLLLETLLLETLLLETLLLETLLLVVAE